MLNKDFYPTPIEILERINADLFGKIVYDPSAGSGNILDYALSQGASKTIATEIEPKFRIILKDKHQILAKDFLSVVSEQISHVNVIFMNPPFSADEKHILHAYEIAPDGCEIYAICNWQTLQNAYTRERRQLKMLIEKYGYSEYFGNCFNDAEAKGFTLPEKF